MDNLSETISYELIPGFPDIKLIEYDRTGKLYQLDRFFEMCGTNYLSDADDDGFVGNPKRIERMIGSSPDDNRILYSKGFTIPFESGIIVIKHWRMHKSKRLRKVKTWENGKWTKSKVQICLNPHKDCTYKHQVSFENAYHY